MLQYWHCERRLSIIYLRRHQRKAFKDEMSGYKSNLYLPRTCWRPKFSCTTASQRLLFIKLPRNVLRVFVERHAWSAFGSYLVMAFHWKTVVRRTWTTLQLFSVRGSVPMTNDYPCITTSFPFVSGTSDVREDMQKLYWSENIVQ